MVSIHTAQNFQDTEVWLASLTSVFSPVEIGIIRRACELTETLYAGKNTLTGTPLLQHALGTASILLGMNMDHETIAATILHAAP